jgi:hypothetical protein
MNQGVASGLFCGFDGVFSGFLGFRPGFPGFRSGFIGFSFSIFPFRISNFSGSFGKNHFLPPVRPGKREEGGETKTADECVE